jgi:SAM-dependent methyltransferase
MRGEERLLLEKAEQFWQLNHQDPGLMYGPVLDVGCGKPRFNKLVWQDWPWIYADLFPREPGIVPANVTVLPFKDCTFSQVIACRVVSNVIGREYRIRALRELRRVLKPGGRLYLFDSHAASLAHLNSERVQAGMEALPKARTGSVPLDDDEVSIGLDMEVKSYGVAPKYYVWTRYQFPFLNEGRFPENDKERTPPVDFEPHPAVVVQKLWVYDKVSG